MWKSMQIRRKERHEKSKEYRRGLRHGIIGTVIAVAVILFLVLFRLMGPALSVNPKLKNVLSLDALRKYQYLSAEVQKNYYGEFDTDAAREELYASLFDSLDKYSVYYSPEEYEEYFGGHISGEAYGMGVTITQSDDGRMMIYTVMPESPAEAAGVLAGDELKEVEGTQITKESLPEDVSKIVREDEDGVIHLDVFREDAGKELELTVTCGDYVTPTVYGEMLRDGVGLVTITNFTNHTADQFRKIVEDLQKEGMTALAIDLRSNGGGSMKGGVNTADAILKEGLIVYTLDNEGGRIDYECSDDYSMDLPIAVLVSGNTASASEILTGALRDYGAATIVGTQTFGKGVVQDITALEDGSGYLLTAREYFTPKDGKIHEVGIAPDVEIEFEYQSEDTGHYDWRYDNQVLKAIEVLTDKNSYSN